MLIWMYDAILLISAFIFGVVGTGIAYVVLRRMNVVDEPNERSNHSEPTLRGGGLGIIFAVTCFLTVADAPGAIIWGFLGLAGLSFWDDLKPLPASKRLLVQLALVTWAVLSTYNGHVLEGFLPLWAEKWLIIVAWLWFINLFNFMDGSDGLAGSEALCICAGLLAMTAVVDLPPYATSFSLLIFGGVLGFMVWNWHPAKIFMGDVGSIPLGFILGFMLVSLAGEGYWAAAVILPAVFVADASYTLLTRGLRGKRITQAHSEHAYQRAIRGGLAHDHVARTVIGVNIMLIILAVLTTLYTPLICHIAFVTAAYAIVFALLAYFAGQKKDGAASEDTPEYTEAEIVEEIPAPGAALADNTGEEKPA